MNRSLLTLIIIFIVGSLASQDMPEAFHAYHQKYPVGTPLNHWDSLYLMNLPEKHLPAELRGAPLPPVVDNSNTPFLRPVFGQAGPSCGQAAMVGYNFTYEMDYVRNLPANVPENLYPTHFTWNFQNGGNGWYGVSYFHSIEILRKCGCMNTVDYGGLYDDGFRWISGYDNYYNGMFNRVRGVYSINTGTAQGIQTLKYWLFNHMGEGSTGGVASYYANTPWNAHILNDTTPEGGKHVVTDWYPIASHAMTVVGYNDSIRWDYNNDGFYTNNLDLNDDGIIDPRDWEIGAFKFVNSHGLDAQDSGFCYLMYKCIAETFENGGIWNRSVHILDVAENYEPMMTFKITLKHSYREKVKILAGVSGDTSDISPAWLMDFPIIDYQGAYHYLQGHDTAMSQQYLEFGLDVTPLLSYLQPGEPAKFFFIVDENDPDQEGGGEITSFSVMDYTSGVQQIPSEETPVSIENNSRTIASVIHVPDFDIVEITTDSIPPFTANEPYLYLLQAQGGSTPYSWEPDYKYRLEQSTESFPYIDENQVLINAETDSIVAVSLGFNFPYYGTDYDTVYMHVNGHLQFDNAQIPWPYMMEPMLHFRSNRIIAPMTDMSFTILPSDGDGGWYETDDTSAIFRWKVSYAYDPVGTDLNFAARICQNGNIDFIYGPAELGEFIWLSGISAGDNKDYAVCPDIGPEQVTDGKKFSFLYWPMPPGLNISANGLLSGTMASDDIIYDLSCRVTDQSGLSDTKQLQLTSGPYLHITSDGEDHVNYGDTVGLDLKIRNGGEVSLSNTTLVLSTNDPFIQLTDPNCQPGTLLPGQVMVLPDAFQIIVSTDIPDQHDVVLNCALTTTNKVWHKELIFKANAPIMKLKPVTVDDNENGRLDPGETAPILVTFQNAGHAALDGVSAELFPLDPEVLIIGSPLQDYGTIGKGASVARSYILHADDSAPEGLTARFILFTESLQGLQRQDTINLRIGRTPVLVIDMDPNHHSGPFIYSQLDELGVFADYEYTITDHISEYQSLFISLGYHNSNHVLTLGEGTDLALYLEDGGKIYMEGKKTWRDDPGTPIQPMFNIGFDGNVTVYDTITGIDGTFTAGTRLLNGTLHNLNFYHMVPIPPAFTILQDNNLLLPCAVAYDAGNYKTIGSLFDFGTLVDLNPSLKSDLMISYLEFFNIYMNPIGIEENGGGEAWGQGGLVVWPNPVSRQLTITSSLSPSPNWGRDGVGAVSSQQSKVRLVIFDTFGRKMKEFDDIASFPFIIDISGLSSGLYILQMISEDGLSTSAKFLKISE